MTHWTTEATEMITTHGWAVLVTVSAAHGSIPREAGAKMLVGPEGIKGTIGGGTLEQMAMQQARLMAASDGPYVRQLDVPLGPKTQQCCGGRVELLLERLDPQHLGLLAEIDRADTRLTLSSLHSVLTGPNVQKTILPQPVETVLQTASTLFEPLGDRRTPLYLFGAGHVGKAIAARLDNLPFRVIWVDRREEEFPNYAPANVEKRISAASVEVVAEAPPGCAYLVMSYSHRIDYAITAAILARRDAAYCGLIGSKTKRSRFLKRFREEDGLSEEDCARLTCPIGLGSIPGKAPEVVAIGVIAQLLEIFG
jgi:xanthine dehydrogenase accessory factor